MASKKPCREQGCERPKVGNKQSCYWHWLLRQPIEVQEHEAQRRLARTPEDRRRSRVPEREWPVGARWCSGCQWMVPLFYARGSRCRACASRASHRAASQAKYTWPEGMDYDKLLALQGGRCAICRCTPRTRRLAIDHDHETGIVRGLCCTRCNHDLLGAAMDSLQVLENAVYYLKNPPAQSC